MTKRETLQELDDLMEGAPTVDEIRAGSADRPLDFAHDKEWIAGSAKYQITDDLRRALKEEGITQSELGRRTGQKRQDIWQIINKHRNLQIDTMAGFAAALGWQLVVRYVSPTEAMPLVPASTLPEVRRLIRDLPTEAEQDRRKSYVIALNARATVQVPGNKVTASESLFDSGPSLLRINFRPRGKNHAEA